MGNQLKPNALSGVGARSLSKDGAHLSDSMQAEVLLGRFVPIPKGWK
jgi:hypothetical protein